LLNSRATNLANFAQKMKEKLIKIFGDILRVDDEIYYAFPTPQKLASADIEKLRKCGLSFRKARCIRDVSKMILNKNLDLDKREKYEDTGKIIAELSKISGIGVWTAEMTMVRGLHKFEVVPADDIGLQRNVSNYYSKGRKITSQAVQRIAGK